MSNPYGAGGMSPTAEVDRRLGEAYHVVKVVYDSLSMLGEVSVNATNASVSAAAALVSQTAAAASASTAAESAAAATTKAGEASNSATSANAARIAAQTAQTAAEAALASALSSFDSFDDRYLGAKSAPPTLDNDGSALLAGALYYRTTAPVGMYVWTGSIWSAAYVDGALYLPLTGGSLSGNLEVSGTFNAAGATRAPLVAINRTLISGTTSDLQVQSDVMLGGASSNTLNFNGYYSAGWKYTTTGYSAGIRFVAATGRLQFMHSSSSGAPNAASDIREVGAFEANGNLNVLGAIGAGGPITATGGIGVGGNAVFPSGSYAYTPYNGATDTATIRAGIQFDGSAQTLNFYTANGYRGGFGPNGDLTLAGAAVATGASVSTSDCSFSLGGGRTGSGNGVLDIYGQIATPGLRLLRAGGANANSAIYHYGTGSFTLNAYSAAPLILATSNTERARFTPEGKLLIGGNTEFDVTTAATLLVTNESGGSPLAVRTSATGPQTLASWYNGSQSARCGWIGVDGNTTSYNAASDKRLKENIAAAAEAGGIIDSLEVVSYTWKVDGKRVPYGLIAQDVYAVFPQAAYVGDGDPTEVSDPWGIDYSKFVPVLIKGYQEQAATIEALTARIAALEAA